MEPPMEASQATHTGSFVSPTVLPPAPPAHTARTKRDVDYVFYELTRSICPQCRRVIDAKILLRDNKVYMRKRCPEHGEVEALVYGDAHAYTSAAKFNKPGTIPLAFSTEIARGCPYDCGLCPDHQQHTCLGIIEVNSACNMDCPLCFANAGAGFNLTLEEVEGILDHLLATEGSPEVVQFSGGEPSIHPQIMNMMKAAKRRDIRYVMLNTNGKRIADDDAFLADLAEVRPAIYFQFDGFERETYRALRGEPEILPQKLRALDRLAAIGLGVVLVPAVERDVNLHEVGAIVQFALQHPAVRGINFQPAFHAGRHVAFNPLERLTIPDILAEVERQTEGLFTVSDFVPVPCCFPTCNSVTYALLDGDDVLPLPRVLNVDDYLDYVTNRVTPDLSDDIKRALEGLWSSSAVAGSDAAAQRFALSCAACGLPAGPDSPGGQMGELDLGAFANKIFMIMLQDFMDPWTFNQKNLMKCCKEFLLPDGKQIPFCAYNTLGYREQARVQLAARERARNRARRAGVPYEPQPLTFTFEHAPSHNGPGAARSRSRAQRHAAIANGTRYSARSDNRGRTRQDIRQEGSDGNR
jgi:7,8-dihydro-6-hydroxymethylpterin dimethyltransferase